MRVLVPFLLRRFRLNRITDSLFNDRRDTGDERIGRHVFGDDSARGRHRAATDAHGRDEHRVRANLDLVLDDSLVLVLAVIVTGDRTRLDVFFF